MYTLALQGSEEAFHRGVVVPSPDAVHAGLDAMSFQQRLVPLVSVLAALIGVPCLLYVGEMDGVHPIAKEWARQMANVTFVTLPGLGHGEAIRRSDEVLPHVKRFLAAVNR